MTTRGALGIEKKDTVQLRTSNAGIPMTNMNKITSRKRDEPLRALRLLCRRLKKIPSHPIHNYDG